MSNKANLEMFTVDYISGAMSLRKPQRRSLEILEDIFNSVQPCKEIDKAFATQKINSKYPIYKDFERDFMSLTFALATGVGKTRLMGAFIAYLYAQKGIKNFFVVAPGTTIYNKLRSDFGDVSNPKYVFKGLSCFDEAPTIIDDENYRNRLNRDEDINIFIFNIGKFDKEKAKLRSINEMLGESFYNMVSNLDDLVLLMDESHHYRAEKGMDALNALKPILGLELTATPVVTSGSKQVPFKNVVYEYPLKQSIADGYTRTPVALARTDLDLLSFGDEQWDKLMLEDGIKNHEKMKRALENYARKNNKPVVKPFMLVVCKDTEHAKVIENYIKSDDFCYGDYRDKTIVVTSKQGKVESDQNQEMLLNVEKSTNPVEIVIHVNMLKEGWDVNNLYTIVPLRTAASKVLREQMVGRGLRLPYGERTCNEDVDSVVLTAHNKFQEIMDEAIAGNSIFNQGNVITTDDWFREEDRFVQTNIEMELPDEARDGAYSLTNVERNDDNTKVIDRINKVVPFEVEDEIQISKNLPDRKTTIRKIAENTKKKISEDRDLGKIYAEHKEPFDKLIDTQAEKSYGNFIDGYIPIPVIKITGAKVAKQGYYDFDLDTSEFTHEPIESKAFTQRVGTPSERIYLEDFGTISFEAKDPVRKLAAMIRDKSDVDYDECSELLHKLILQVCEHYSAKYNDDKMKNIVMSNVRDISDKIHRQLQSHYYQQTEGNLFETVTDIRPFNIMPEYKYQEFCRYDDPRYEKSIKSVGFEGMKKSVFARVRFDSEPERKFAVLLEQEPEVLRWLRPAPKEFQFSSIRKGDYDPDFIVATQDKIYMVEVKAEDEMSVPEVLRKKDIAVKYCELASKWSKLNGYREWEYALIPDSAIGGTMTFAGLRGRYKAK